MSGASPHCPISITPHDPIIRTLVCYVKGNRISNSNLTTLTTSVNPKDSAKVDGGYASVSLAAGAWTTITIPLNNKLSSIAYIQVTPYVDNLYRIYAPIVTAYTANSVTVKIYNQETAAFTMGIWVLAYGK